MTIVETRISVWEALAGRAPGQPLGPADPGLWRASSGDPGRMLGEVSADRLSTLAPDRRFLRRLSAVYDDLSE